MALPSVKPTLTGTPPTLTGPLVGNGNQANQTDGTPGGLKLPNRNPASGQVHHHAHHHSHFHHNKHHQAHGHNPHHHPVNDQDLVNICTATAM